MFFYFCATKRTNLYEKSVEMYKKTALLLFLAIIVASCGTRKTAVTSSRKLTSTQKDIIDYGMKYLNKPYRYAGKGPNAFDCSGFTSFVFRKFGYNLSTSSSGQDRQLPPIRRKEELQTGDLVFFEGRRHSGQVGHVGIVKDVLPNGEFRFLHASTSNGVIVSSSTEPYYASRYLRGGRVLKELNYAQSQPDRKTAEPKKPDKRKNAFTPAKAKKNKATEPNPIDLKELQPKENVFAETASPQQADTSAIVIHSRPAEPLSNEVKIEESETSPIKTSQPDSTENKEGINQQVQQAMVLQEPVTIPEPAEMQPDSLDTNEEKENITLSLPLTHTVKMGETLYAIARKYQCTVAQLKAWNPQLGNVLKTGDVLTIYP